MEHRLEVFHPRTSCDHPTLAVPAQIDDFIREFRENNWRTFVDQVPWACNGWPGIAAERISDSYRLWVCAYDWRIDFGIQEDTSDEPVNFVVGLLNIPAADQLTAITKGRRLDQCDFLISDEQEVINMARLFFANKSLELMQMLLKREPTNRFS